MMSPKRWITAILGIFCVARAFVKVASKEQDRDTSRANLRGHLENMEPRGRSLSLWPNMLYNVDRPLFDFNVLVTGYLPFGKHPVNPAFEVAQSLNRSCDTIYLRQPHTFRICYEGMALPVNTEGSSKVAGILETDPYRWDGILHLGFESEAKGLRLETIAANVKATEEYGSMWNAEIPCNKEGTPHEDIFKDAPCVLPTTAPVSYLDLMGMAELLSQNGLTDLVSRETWSRDAGAYYCNDIFFRTLHTVRGQESPWGGSQYMVPVMFVHLPTHKVVGGRDMVRMVSYIAESMMVGTVGLIP
ncbi:unnamed protein product [Discosporangium mesarthrocarpum]